MKRIFLAGILFVLAAGNGYADDALILKKIDSEMKVICDKLVKIRDDIIPFTDTKDALQALELMNACVFTVPHIVYIHNFIECYQTLECETDKKIVMDCICDKMTDVCVKYVDGHIEVVSEILKETQEAKLITLGETLKLQLHKLTTLISEETEKAEGSNKS